MHRIFISYNRQTLPIVEAISRDLEARGHTVWHDKQLIGGQRWWDEILKRIRECDVFIFVLDWHVLFSEACRIECTYANALGKRILPVRITSQIPKNLSRQDDALLTIPDRGFSPLMRQVRMPEALLEIQYLDYEVNDRESAVRLARILEQRQKPSGLPNPLPKPPEIPYGDAHRAELEALGASRSPVPNYLVFAFLSILLFWPLAIPAIVFGFQVKQKTARGDHFEARQSSKKARTLVVLAFIVGAIHWAVSLIIVLQRY